IRSVIGMAARLTHVPSLRRMEGRRGTGLPPEYVRSFPLFGLRYRLRVQRATKEEERTAAWIWGGRRFCELAAPAINRCCGAVYAFTSAAKELFERAREMNAHTYLDHATPPFSYERSLVQEEKERFPDWALDEEPDHLIEDYQRRQHEELHLADIV